MEDERRTTVIIPNLNGRDYLEKCLASLGDSEAEIIVVDNGSNDGSYEMISEKFPMVRCIRNSQNCGFSKAVNQGVAEADTEFVFLLNNDTTVSKHCIHYLERRMDMSPNIFAVQAKMLRMSEPEVIDDAGDLYCLLGWSYARGKGHRASRFSKPAEVFSCCGGAAMYRRKLYNELGGMDENHFAYLEDVDIGYRAKIFGYHNLIEPKAVVYHQGSATTGSRYNPTKIDLAARNSIYLVSKNMPFPQRLLNLPALTAGLLIKQIFFVRKGYGRVYFMGVLKGISLSCCRSGQDHKVGVRWYNFWNYCHIEVEMIVNTFKPLMR
jgi:GT2 family glycosyltransferase